MTDRPVGGVSVVALGKLGVPLAACFAAKALRTIGVDASPRVIDALTLGRPCPPEPGLAALLAAPSERFNLTSQLDAAILLQV